MRPGILRMATRGPRLAGVTLWMVLAASPWTIEPVAAQERVARSAALQTVVTYPPFFHGQAVRTRGELSVSEASASLVTGEQSIVLIGQAVAGLPPQEGGGEIVEIIGTVLDLGRLDREDPRLATYDAGSLSVAYTGREWPRPGELPVLLVSEMTEPRRDGQPTLRDVSLEPDRFMGEEVSVLGRFRGRNLFGDLPDAPGRSVNDFVLQLADATIWVTGLEPSGDGFDLRLDARQDTGTWLQVSGTVAHGDGLVWIEGTDVALAEEPDTEPRPAAVVAVPVPDTSAEVIFSTPLEGETTVAADADVRIQFSHDMDEDTFEGRVSVRYADDSTAVPLSMTYDEGRRVLYLQFPTPLDRFRPVEVELDDGILSLTGASLVPWHLTFTVG